mgnify:FL=1
MIRFKHLLLFLFLLQACGGINDAKKVLKNQKTSNTDEFLVKKKEPLVLPPNFDELPKPGSKSQTKTSEGNDIKKILKAPQTEDLSKKSSSSIEDVILEKIKE